MSVSATKHAILEGLVPELTAEGYETFVQPAPPLVPAFLGAYRPDLIAIKGDKRIAIEVKRGGRSDSPKLSLISKLFDGHPEWEFRIVWIDAEADGRELAASSTETILSRIEELRNLVHRGFAGPALLLGWAIFEAVGRRLVKDRLRHPQTPGRLVEALATEGLLLPDEADLFRVLARKRNGLVHGELDTVVEPPEMTTFVEILSRLGAEGQTS